MQQIDNYRYSHYYEEHGTKLSQAFKIIKKDLFEGYSHSFWIIFCFITMIAVIYMILGNDYKKIFSENAKRVYKLD